MAIRPTLNKSSTGAKRGTGPRGPRADSADRAATEEAAAQAPAEGGDGKVMPKLYGRPYFQRKKSCPFSGPRAPQIDYKDTRLLARFISDYGKIIPSHISGVSAKKQRELARAIKRARQLALLGYTSRNV